MLKLVDVNICLSILIGYLSIRECVFCHLSHRCSPVGEQCTPGEKFHVLSSVCSLMQCS